MRANRHLVTVVMLALMTAFSLAVAAPAWAGITAPERTLVQLINQERSRRGLHTVALSTPLCRAAEAHSLDMMTRQYFSHRSVDGRTVSARVSRSGYARAGYSYWAIGEVISWGSGILGTPRSTLARWMESKGHRAVLLDPRWRDIGVGRVTGTFLGVPNAAVYTVDLGRRIN